MYDEQKANTGRYFEEILLEIGFIEAMRTT